MSTKKRHLLQFRLGKSDKPIYMVVGDPGKAHQILRNWIRRGPQKQQSTIQPDSFQQSEDEVWLNADLGENLPPYDWDRQGIPKGKPVKFVPGHGFVVEGGKDVGD